jgi:hypothetical protein
MNIIDEVELVGGGHRRFQNQIHAGYWTPELATWTEKDGFTEIRDLQFFSWVEGERITGDEVNASPVLCIPKTNIGHEDLTVSVTGLIGLPSSELGYHYTGTYTFADDEIFSIPADWYAYEQANTNVQVIMVMDGHSTVVELNDYSAAGGTAITGSLGSQQSGTVEFWFRTNDNSVRQSVIELIDDSTQVFDAQISGGIIFAIDGFSAPTICDIESDVWYRSRVDYETSDTGYLGLGRRKWNIYVYDSGGSTLLGQQTGINSSAFYDGYNINRIVLGEYYDNIDTNKFYIDAVGYSWDTGYSLGDNIGYTGITGDDFSSDIQYGITIYKREYYKGGGIFNYEFTIPKFTNAGTIFEFPSKRIYKITDIDVSPSYSDQGFMELGFYALGDNGSKLLYTLNWNNIFENVTKSLFGQYPQPRKCDRCLGSGYVATESDTCVQCYGYGFSGPNASGFLLDQLGREYGTMRGDDSVDLYRNKLWALHAWHVTPTKNEIKRYLAHFARTTIYEVTIHENDRIFGPTGVESVVDVQLPYDLPEAIFDVADPIWSRMAESVEPAGIQIRFSFVSEGITGSLDLDSWLDPIAGYYKEAIFYTGIGASGEFTVPFVSGTVYGFEEPFETIDLSRSSWYKAWGEDWLFFNYGPSGHISGGISGLSGLLKTGASSPVWASGLLQGDEWILWAWPENTLVNDTVWHTGGSTEMDQGAFLTGVVYYDNFWVSGLDGIQY